MFRKPNPFSIQSSKSTLTDDVLWSQRNKCFRKLRRLWVIYIPGKTVSLSNLFSKIFFSFPLNSLFLSKIISQITKEEGILFAINEESGGYFPKTPLHIKDVAHRNSVVSSLHTLSSFCSWLMTIETFQIQGAPEKNTGISILGTEGFSHLLWDTL